MGRFASALAFLAALVVVVIAAGCGQRFNGSAGEAPAPADLAANALQTLESKGSAHFVADMKTGLGTEGGFGLTVHLEGDASATAVDADGSVSLGGPSLEGHVLVGEHDLFIKAMGQWFHEDQGLVEGMAETKKEHDGHVWDELATPAGVRRNFGELFDGKVTEGPTMDGVPTWQFEGKLDADGVADFARRYEAQLTDRDEDILAKTAAASHVLLIVGQEDQLPRRLEFSVQFTSDQLEEMNSLGGGPLGDSANFKASVQLSDFGKPVEINPPSDFKPLDALFEQLFSGFE
jgi:hypothetical protein